MPGVRVSLSDQAKTVTWLRHKHIHQRFGRFRRLFANRQQSRDNTRKQGTSLYQLVSKFLGSFRSIRNRSAPC